MTEKNKELADMYVDFQFTTSEIQSLIEVLQFSTNAATLLSEHEMLKGTVQGAVKMNAVVQNSKQLLDIIIATAQLGPMPDDPMH